ncbi:uncharacterized protein [Nicotiana tomentosiformis]|uniref:uncharacterized protein n=1 Tax=Nicotiana tomentosiformis TaxID=4098 RepID=UPI00388C568F
MTPQQNGVAEWMNRTFLERACCMISNTGLTNAFWAKAISTTCYIVNRAPSAPLNFKTLEEMWSDKENNTQNQVEIEIGIPSEPSSSTLEQNTVETPEVEPETKILEVETPEVEPEDEEYSIAKHRPRREGKQPLRFGDYVVFAFTIAQETEEIGEPSKYSEAVSGADSANCVYFRKLNDGSFVYLLLYVDNMLIVAKDLEENHNLKSELKSEFEMKDLGAAKKILGMEIKRDRKANMLFLTEKKYLEKVLERFVMKDVKSVSTPLAAHFKLSAAQSPQSKEEERHMAQVPYSSAVGSIMYAMVCTRPDISQAVSVVSQYMACPGKAHWHAVKWILRYLRE